MGNTGYSARQVISAKNSEKSECSVAEPGKILAFRKHASTEVRLKKDDAWKLSPVALSVYCRILWHARGNNHECFAQVETLQLKGKRAKVCDDFVRDGRKELQEKNLIRVEFQKRGTAIIRPIAQPKSPDDVFVPRNIVEELRPRELALWCRIYQPDNGSPAGCLLPPDKLNENLGSARSCASAFNYMVKAGHIHKTRHGRKDGKIRYALTYLHPDGGESFFKWKQSNPKLEQKRNELSESEWKISPSSALQPMASKAWFQNNTYRNKRDNLNILSIDTYSDQHTKRARYVDKAHFPIQNLNRSLLKTREVQESITGRYREYGFTPEAIQPCLRAYGPEGMLYALALLRSEYGEGNWYHARFGEIRLRKRKLQSPAAFLSECLTVRKSEHEYDGDWKLPDEWFDDHGFRPVAEDGSFVYRKPQVQRLSICLLVRKTNTIQVLLAC